MWIFTSKSVRPKRLVINALGPFSFSSKATFALISIPAAKAILIIRHFYPAIPAEDSKLRVMHPVKLEWSNRKTLLELDLPTFTSLQCFGYKSNHALGSCTHRPKCRFLRNIRSADCSSWLKASDCFSRIKNFFLLSELSYLSSRVLALAPRSASKPILHKAPTPRFR